MKRHTHHKKNKKIDLYPKDLFSKLEMDKVLALLSDQCHSPLGKQLVQNTKVLYNFSQIQIRLLQTAEMKHLIQFEKANFPASGYVDISEEIKFLNIQGSVLSETQFARVFKSLQVIAQVLSFFDVRNENRVSQYPKLYQLVEGVNINSELLLAFKAVFTNEGTVKNDASPELRRIRKQITSQYTELNRKFNALLTEYRNSNWLADTQESIRNGRRVLAVLAEYKRKVNGIIHDESNTGQTTFIEPEATLLINNNIISLQQEEKREIYRILKALTEKLRPYIPEFKQQQKLLGQLDYIHGKATLAWQMDAHLPRISQDRVVEVFNARHPLLYLKNKQLKKKTIPLNYQLNIANRILVISGPNAGGKSVMLKTVGLLQIMLQCGLLIPLNDHSTMAIFQKIFTDMGDEQSIENDLSTYSSRLKNMRYFVEHTNNKTLILIDEFGTGTDPAQGAAIAETVLEHLLSKFSYGIITTHYPNLKIFADNNKGLVNGSMTFNYKNLSPTYQLEIGKPGSSFAFELAAKSGFSNEFINTAKSKVDAKYQEFDELLTGMRKEKSIAAERERNAKKLENKYRKLAKQFEEKNEEIEKKQQEILLNTEKEALQQLTETNKKFENLVREIRENKAPKAIVKKTKQALQTDKKQLATKIEKRQEEAYYRDNKDAEIAVGSLVRLLNGGNEIGEVISLRNNNAMVQFGKLRTSTKKRDLVVVEPQEANKYQNKPRKPLVNYNDIERSAAFKNSIDIRGMRREEALRAVEQLLDQGLISNADQLKIIHGIGDGILRRSVRELLRKYKAVKSINDEESQYGGQGVSIVTLN